MNDHTESHTIILYKPAKRQLQETVIQNNLTALLSSINNKSLAIQGWTLEAGKPTPWSQEDYLNDGAQYLYKLMIVANFARRDGRKPGKNDLASIVRTMNVRAGQPAFGKWAVAFVDGDKYTAPDDDDSISGNINADLIGYTEVTIPATWDENFTHLFGLDPHISRIKGALEAGVMSDWSNRFHCALVGPPGCGKSDICESIKRALGEDAVIKFDATATTAAGAIKELSEREILPRVIVIEEIEKAPETAMSFLLGVLDQRSEIRKTTARGSIQRDTKLFAIATVNDYALFTKLQAGALASRFANKIGFQRPSREHLALILTREVNKVDGDPAWIGPALDYCEDHDITDPRRVVAMCLCGRDEWLTGEYAKMLDQTEIDS